MNGGWDFEVRGSGWCCCRLFRIKELVQILFGMARTGAFGVEMNFTTRHRQNPETRTELEIGKTSLFFCEAFRFTAFRRDESARNMWLNSSRENCCITPRASLRRGFPANRSRSSLGTPLIQRVVRAMPESQSLSENYCRDGRHGGIWESRKIFAAWK